MKKKLRIGILYGGKSAEHEVSLQSARNVINAIDKESYDIIPIAISRDGQWQIGDTSNNLSIEDLQRIALNEDNENIAFYPGRDKSSLLNVADKKTVGAIDVVFPVLHGPYGEDGTVQGFLKLAGLPFVGSSVLGSAVGMDKDVMKRILRDAGLSVADFHTIYFHESNNIDFDLMKQQFGVPFFIKPAGLGSSVGVHKVDSAEQFEHALKDAFSFDNKVLIEQFVDGREIECAVLGNESPIASLPGEVLPSHEFYSYEAKYIDEKGAVLQIPARLPEKDVERIQSLSLAAFKAICCEGMARVDCFYKKDGTIIINELNTIPGFTSISMYPMLWEASGISYRELIDRLIGLALERHEREGRLRTTYLQKNNSKE